MVLGEEHEVYRVDTGRLVGWKGLQGLDGWGREN